MTTRRILVVALLVATCCTHRADPLDPPTEARERAERAEPSLLLTQAQFTWEIDAAGRRQARPGPAKLLRLTPAGDEWRAEILEDPDSRVFHKALCRNNGREIVTIGGTDAHLKTWTRAGSTWRGRSHWAPKFGGQWDRLRDLEIGDVDRDGSDELVIATHDQGVIAVAEVTPEGFFPEAVFRRASTFIHEIEIGDVDGDGKAEFFATVSAPNQADSSQGGSVMAFFVTADRSYRRETVVEYRSRHAKEILVTDVDQDGKDELYVSVEARTETVGGKLQQTRPLEILAFRWTGPGKPRRERVAMLQKAVQARVLLAGDLEAKGSPEILVTTMRDGIWRLLPRAGGMWATQQIDAHSSGFEHAAGLADLDGDGRPELYVAADDQDEVRRYQLRDGRVQRRVIHELEHSDLTWSIEACP